MLSDCRFNDSWTLNDDYVHLSSWTKNNHKVRFMLCLKDIDIIAVWDKGLVN